MIIEWTPELTVNNEQLDKQHQQWIKLLDDFYEGIKQGKPKEELKKLIIGMLNYTRYHFKEEEQHMQRIGYPNLEKHKALHAEYIQKIEDYHERMMSGRLILSLEVTGYLKTWLINHIKGEDQRYAE